jgi:hypothetical protein
MGDGGPTRTYVLRDGRPCDEEVQGHGQQQPTDAYACFADGDG